MVETDWRQILSFSQRELNEADKEKLCESLSWMEADDIELNFADLKTLFRLAQDIMKFKSEQVNNLLGELELFERKNGKKKSRIPFEDSPTRSSDDVFETIAHQEELIKANKDILEQLYTDIAELEGRKNKLAKKGIEYESDSSRNTLSEINAIEKLEDEVVMKNRHIRKLLSDVKILEEENVQLKEKTSTLKDKLTEATKIIENLSDQLFSLNSDQAKLKERLGKSEEQKVKLALEIESLQEELVRRESDKDNTYQEIRSKLQHWKNIAKSNKSEYEALIKENNKLKEELSQVSETTTPPSNKDNHIDARHLKELQEKLFEASNEIVKSTKIIESLKSENIQLREIVENKNDNLTTNASNASDAEKEAASNILSLTKKVENLTVSLHESEEMVALREKELAEIASQLQLLQSGEEGITTLIDSLKTKKRQLKFKDEGIKSLVQEVNALHQTVDDLQLQNEAMRLKLHLPSDTKIPTTGIIKKYRGLEKYSEIMKKKLIDMENKLISSELDIRNKNANMSKLINFLCEIGYNSQKIKEIYESDDTCNEVPIDGSGDTVRSNYNMSQTEDNFNQKELEIQNIIEENEGLRKGLQELFEFMKDNSTSTSGVLALQCPSLEAVLNSMEARHVAGWEAPHIAAILQLRAALGGRDALLTALHDARKETYEVMDQLSKESKKSEQLEMMLQKLTSKPDHEEVDFPKQNTNLFSELEFGTWMSAYDSSDIDIQDKNQIENIISLGNNFYENQLKISLAYFHKKFKSLFDKLTHIMIKTSDNQNKWSIQEEEYKAEIENLKSQITPDNDEEKSDDSPGLIINPFENNLQRRCSYLEDSYKFIRTLLENLKSEHLESIKEAMLINADYESTVQKLLMCVKNLSDKLRHSVSAGLFWKQSEILSDVSLKYRILKEANIKTQVFSSNLLQKLEHDKREIIGILHKSQLPEGQTTENMNNSNLSNVELSIMQKQVERLSGEIEENKKIITDTESRFIDLQKAQLKLINTSLSSPTQQELHVLRQQITEQSEKNEALKNQCRHVTSQLDITLLQLRDVQYNQMSRDTEINMLRHQILDLQSTGDNKAIIARLSGEILVSHLQVTESNNKLERLDAALKSEIQKRMEAEEMLQCREKIFNVYAQRYESKFKYMYEVIQTLRQQYQGSLPLISIEHYLDNIENLNRKNKAVNEKLNEIEDLQTNLIIKQTVLDQIIKSSKTKCLADNDNCPHKIKLIVMEGTNSRAMDHCHKKITVLEQSREDIVKYCNNLEKTLILLNQGFESLPLNGLLERNGLNPKCDVPNLEVEDIQSDEEHSSKSNRTITLPKPQILKTPKNSVDMTKYLKEDNMLPGSPIKKQPEIQKVSVKKVDISVQTASSNKIQKQKTVQTEVDMEILRLQNHLKILEQGTKKNTDDFAEAIALSQKRMQEISTLTSEKSNLRSKIKELVETNSQKDQQILSLQSNLAQIKAEIDDYYKKESEKNSKRIADVNQETDSLLKAVKKLEEDKNNIVAEYKQIMSNERDEYLRSVRDLNGQIVELQTQLDRKESDSSNTDTVKQVVSKYSLKVVELEDKCFKLQSELEGHETEIKSYKSEAERWKALATERLAKMEQLNTQLEVRHGHEVESYKAENQHWLSQLNETQREHMELRNKITEQKTLHVKQLTEKDAQIEHLKTVVHNLKAQLMNMQTMMSVHDPSFDLSAIVEVEDSDGASQRGSDRLEIRFDSSPELRDDQHVFPSSSTAIWQEPIIERLRREKQFTGKQNSILRRQIKALAGRERRSRLEAQNLKNQVYRISTSGSKAATAETVALQAKISSLQAQLTSARRDNQSSVALWDKWKRAQQSSERWQARYEEKCREVKKLETCLNFAKSAVTRLEREKRVLLSNLSESRDHKEEHEKQEHERSEKLTYESPDSELASSRIPSHLSIQSLMDRIEAQQRRIAALELAEKGNEPLVSEYEKAMAENAALKGQVLKLESALLEAQIRCPMKSSPDPHPELEYWKSYSELLKTENMQLAMRLGTDRGAPQDKQHLEQTVLTLRGLVSKLQAEQKSSAVAKRVDSRPSSRISVSDKSRSQLESYRIEIANLKRSISDKDNLLERSKEMLKIAAEREDELLRENAYLRRQLDELTRPKGGFLSA